MSRNRTSGRAKSSTLAPKGAPSEGFHTNHPVSSTVLTTHRLKMESGRLV